jgi:hypothetical protein
MENLFSVPSSKQKNTTKKLHHTHQNKKYSHTKRKKCKKRHHHIQKQTIYILHITFPIPPTEKKNGACVKRRISMKEKKNQKEKKQRIKCMPWQTISWHMAMTIVL